MNDLRSAIRQEFRPVLRFLQEAKVTSQLQHPGIVPVHEMGDRRDAFYVMKLLEGVTLGEFVRQHHAEQSGRTGKPNHRLNRFQFGESLEPLLQRFVDVCNAVAYAHRRGVVHRDLKPSNVMIGEFGETVVLDWGLAQSLVDSTLPIESSALDTNPTQAADVSSLFEPNGTVVGTPAYMSPEQAAGQVSKLNQSSDIYSLGVVLYTIIAGRHPYQGQSVDEILDQVKMAVFPRIRSVQPLTPSPLVSILNKTMAGGQEHRYQNAEELANDVRRFIAGDPVSVHQESIVERGVRWCRHHQGIAASVALSLSVLLVATIIFGVVVKQTHHVERIARIEAEHAHREAIFSLREAHDARDALFTELQDARPSHPGMKQFRSELFQHATSLKRESSP